ncbi:hypothetical protein HYALB_00001234 [Hymenoscyphus albidus]|uniref:Uncharacterized protein n=1 Tax=Hymenoscyphus albidus TaxID=595503 RepID=A0A9N9Q2M9_9HELO|nr:hypothetical protein HYALB_00001234 [Hymenoscyphus albidus]
MRCSPFTESISRASPIPLLENASRTGDKTYVRGLNTCVRYDLKLRFTKRERWIRRKNKIQAFMPYGVFSIRPISEKTIEYCVADVLHLPKLCALYLQRLHPAIKNDWLSKVAKESENCVLEAHSLTCDPTSEARKLGLWRPILPPFEGCDFDCPYVDD